ncbi:MAG: hypothetical protein PHD73_12635 [Sediminibacterium sp.]|nr:hypothetical protein [Sediminibacterium sp.]
MKLVNWIFGSAIVLLLIVVAYEATRTDAVQDWLNGLSADAPVVATTTSSSSSNSNSNTQTEPTSTSIAQPAAVVSDSLSNTLQAAASAANQGNLQQQGLHQQQELRQQKEQSPDNTRAALEASKPNYQPAQNNYRIKNPADQIQPRTKGVAAPPPVSKASGEPPPVVYQTPYNSRTFKAASNQPAASPAPATSNYAPPKPAPAAAANEVESAGSFSRKFSQSEINEFVSQYPDRSIGIRFVHFGVLDAEMEAVKSQIIDELVKKGYKEINRGWAIMNGYTSTDDVHFGMNGPRGVNFYIPALPKK